MPALGSSGSSSSDAGEAQEKEEEAEVDGESVGERARGAHARQVGPPSE